MEALRSYAAVLVGGAALDPATRERALAAGVRVVTTYGMSETAGGCVYDGVPLDGVTVELDEDGRILLGGPTLASGYLRPTATAPATRGGSAVGSGGPGGDAGGGDPGGSDAGSGHYGRRRGGERGGATRAATRAAMRGDAGARPARRRHGWGRRSRAAASAPATSAGGGTGGWRCSAGPTT